MRIKMEETFLWDEKYTIGIEYFDKQHKILFKLVNDLSKLINDSAPETSIGNIITELTEYVKVHFKDEENAMMMNNYEFYWQHKKEHEDLMIQVGKFQIRYSKGEAISEELFVFIKNWISNHILVTDKIYGPCLSKKINK
jgi:hemerythrin